MSLNAKPKIFCVAGTRPEYIKLFPVYKELNSKKMNVSWVSSGQHADLVKDLEDFFAIKTDFTLKPKLDKELNLAQRSAELLKVLSELFENEKPDLVIVQGDTLTAVQSALAAYYLKIPVAHVEAGLRTDSIMSPFPEELSRRTISQVSALNFCPTKDAQENLINEGHVNNFLVGNTVIDSLKFALEKITLEQSSRPYILVTAHRNENIAAIESELCPSLEELALENKNIDFIVKVHENPNILKAFSPLYEKNIANIKFIKTTSYPAFIKLMAESEFIVTDSGGVQEEAPYLNKRILVFRKETERQESIDAGFSRLIGTSREDVLNAVEETLKEKKLTARFNNELKIYGDGKAAEKIVTVILSDSEGSRYLDSGEIRRSFAIAQDDGLRS